MTSDHGIGWRPVESVDVLPTLADVLGVETWPDVDGISLWSAPRRRRPRAVVDVPVESLGREVRRIARVKHALVGPDLWRVAPGRSEELIGLPREELWIAAAGDAVAHSHVARRLVRQDPDGEEFPAFFEGVLEGVPSRRRPRVAVMVDGTIAAVTRSYDSHGLKWSGAMLRPGLFGPGEEELELFPGRRREEAGAHRAPASLAAPRYCTTIAVTIPNMPSALSA